MAPLPATNLLSPAELSYLHSCLSLNPPIRPDGRLPTQFRPLVAESEIVAGTYGSARICFADGTEAIVGVKADVEKTRTRHARRRDAVGKEDVEMTEEGDPEDEETASSGTKDRKRKGDKSWLEMTIEIPGYRDDDPLPVFLSSMLSEALLATGELVGKLYINSKWHWKLFVDILLLSTPLSYPLPLLSLTTHLALLSTRLPALVSEEDEDPLFNDDWDAATLLYSRDTTSSDSKTPTNKPEKPQHQSRPPVTLLVISIGSNILFDPTREELAVADSILAVSLAASSSATAEDLYVTSMRTIDPPSRLTTPGDIDLAQQLHEAGKTGDGKTKKKEEGGEGPVAEAGGAWQPPRGGMKRDTIQRVLKMCLGKEGVGREVLEGLEGVDVG